METAFRALEDKLFKDELIGVRLRTALGERVIRQFRISYSTRCCHDRNRVTLIDGSHPLRHVDRHINEIEEERRRLYVAMTRAKDQLALIVPHRFYVHGQARGGDKHLYASRSRFTPLRS